MKIFPKFNQSSKCIICGTNNKGKAILIPIDGTSNGSICEGEQIHLDCVELRVKKTTDGGFIFYQIVNTKGDINGESSKI